MSDVIIVGYGPAGVSASLYALRSGLDVVLLGKDSGALEKAHMIENYYGLERPLSGSDLFAVGKAQAARLGAQIVDDEVTDLYFDGKMFVATGLSGEYRGRACIMATGSARKKQPLPKMAELEGHGVSYCAICDAFFYRGNKELLNVAGSVTLLTNGAEVTAEFPETVKIDRRPLKTLLGEGQLAGAVFMDESEIKLDGLFVALGSASAMDLARKAGAAFENGDVVLDKNFMTTVPGLFAAGDCTGGTLQVAVAVGEGAIAGLAAIKYLRETREG